MKINEKLVLVCSIIFGLTLLYHGLSISIISTYYDPTMPNQMNHANLLFGVSMTTYSALKAFEYIYNMGIKKLKTK